MDFLTVDTTHVVEAPVILGVDTHADTHVAVALDGLGRRLASKTVSATDTGYAELVAWAEGSGMLDQVGVEGSGSFGVGLARFLRARGVPTVPRRWCAPCNWYDVLRLRRALKPPTNCARCSLLLRKS